MHLRCGRYTGRQQHKLCASALRLCAGLIIHAKEKLVDQDALVSSLLAFEFESEGQSSGFGASDDLSEIWGAVGGDKVRTWARTRLERQVHKH